MKNIFTILTEIGLEIPEDKKDEFDKSFKANYKTVNEVTGLNTQIQNLQNKYDEDIKARDEDLENLKTQLSEAGTDKKKLEELTNKFNTLQTDYDTAKTNYEKQLADQKYKFLVTEQVNNIKFSSNSAKKTFIQDVMAKGLSVEDGKLLGFDDYVEQYKKNDEGAFVKDEPNKDEPKPSFVQKAQQIDNPEPETKEVPIVW